MEEDPIQKKILLSGARSLFTLDLARRFAEEGHLVYAAETSFHHVCRFSNAFEKHFAIPSPRFDPEGFLQSLIAICEKEEIDLVIPTFEEIFCLAKGLGRFPKETTIFCAPYETLDTLHNKWHFNQKLKQLGFDCPKSALVSSQEELHALSFTTPYILKPSYSRASMCIQKVTTSTPPKIKIDPNNPLVAQEWLHGKKYCSYSIVHHGKIAAHTVYPVEFSIEGNSCLNFKAIDHPKIHKWVETFAQKENFNGQIAFDFIEPSPEKLYAIECNPRGTSGIHLFQQGDRLPKAFFNTQSTLITPRIGYSKKIGWGMLLYGWQAKRLWTFVKKFMTEEDVIFSKKDPLPFFHQPLLFFVYLYRCFKLRLRLPEMFTFDIDWNGEEIATKETLRNVTNNP
ncbi:MAG: ATP-grasp domain-containing protein [Chlamydiia bacterium]|nr:ATP-grasp domain-containing protein [Chlamydiia bacterium]